MTKICNKNIIILIILTIYSYSFINTQTIIEPINNIINHKKEIVTLEDIKIYKNYNSDNHSPKNIIKFIIKKNVPFIILSIIANTIKAIITILIGINFKNNDNKDEEKDNSVQPNIFNDLWQNINKVFKNSNSNLFILLLIIIIVLIIVLYYVQVNLKFYKNRLQTRMYNTLFKKILDQNYESYNETNYNSILNYIDNIINNTLLIITESINIFFI